VLRAIVVPQAIDGGCAAAGASAPSEGRDPSAEGSGRAFGLGAGMPRGRRYPSRAQAGDAAQQGSNQKGASMEVAVA
jgi:hypothetical protein